VIIGYQLTSTRNAQVPSSILGLGLKRRPSFVEGLCFMGRGRVFGPATSKGSCSECYFLGQCTAVMTSAAISDKSITIAAALCTD